MADSNTTDITVIGAGIVGITSALELARAGFRVTVLDRKGVAAETSRGNAGAFAFADIEPLATPGILRKAPKWLLDPLGPLSMPPAYAMRMLPWMWKFWRASSARNYAAGVAAQSAMMQHSRAALERLVPRVGGEAMLRREGQLQLYATEAEFRASQPNWAEKERHGIRCTYLHSPAEIAEIQPGLNPCFTRAGFTPDWVNVTDPALWTEHLAQALRGLGGRIERAEVRRLRPTETGVEITTDRGPRHAAQVVLAAGAWSHRLARHLGDHLPLETERGYNTTFPTATVDLRTHVTFPMHGFVVTKIGNGLRVGGAVELGGLDLPPDYRRAKTLLQKAMTFLPGLQGTGGTEWMGYRPSLPDSLPAIGHARATHRVIYAFGHGHLGLTQSAGTAELVCALAQGARPQIDLTPFSPARFTARGGR
ncbi:FAD-dependent oxidoreductase [Thioclava sp. GXIMD4216]|uniref:NAD(P)/FAD-dependent oxidoreductase n=1 Tax=Thioclava sp. GXIMD4216 TaxID=3131929 RepID=UPI0030D3E1BF